VIRYLTTNDQAASRLLIPSIKLLMLLLSKLSVANADAVATQATVMQLFCAILHENIRTEDDVDDLQVCNPKNNNIPHHAIASNSFQAAGFTEIILRAINSYGLYEGCAHWLIRACVVPLALSHVVRVEFLNLGGIISVARLLELHTSSRDLAAAVLKATDHLLDHPQLKIEIKKKVCAFILQRRFPCEILLRRYNLCAFHMMTTLSGRFSHAHSEYPQGVFLRCFSSFNISQQQHL
jgi:hypothetical protein